MAARLSPSGTPGVKVHESAYIDDPDTRSARARASGISATCCGTSRIGENCVIGQNVWSGRDVTIGDRCKIQNNVCVYAGVELEDGVFCGPSCVFTNVMNPRAEIERKNEFRPTRW